MGVFAGSFDLAALGFDERALQGLVQKSLVHTAATLRDQQGGEQRRFLLLETLHAFAKEQLQTCDEAHTLHQRHAAYFLQLAETAAQQMQGVHKQAWLLRLDAEVDNLRAVFS